MTDRYRIYYTKTYIDSNNKIDCPCYEDIEAENIVDAIERLWKSFDSTARVKIVGFEELPTYFSEETKQNILKDFMKKC